MTTVAIVGGGITGLAAARELELRSSAEIVLLEASARIGGIIETLEMDGAVVEAGPDWFLTRTDAALEMCRELGLADDLIVPDVIGANIYSGGRLRPLPDGFVRGFPASPRALLRCRHLTVRGRIRALAEITSRSPLDGPDVSLGEFTRTRFGTELLDRLVDPILAASRSGRPDELSLAAAAPEIDSAARSGRSLLRSLREDRVRGDGAPAFYGLRGGMSGLVHALASSLRRTEVRTSAPVRALRRAGTGWEVGAGDDALVVDRVILALPAFAAARLLAPVDGRVAAKLGRIPYAGAVVLSLLYPEGAADPPPGTSGVLIPSTEGHILTAFAWYSAKWRQARPRGGGMIVRCFVGRAAGDSITEVPDAVLVRRVAAELRDIAGVRGEPVAHALTKREQALPVYRVGHLNLVDDIEGALPPHLVLAGAGYRGSGIPDCIGQGRAAAGRIMETTQKEAIR
jgi:oxygen-dependent protoporphyrinogen oxidase